MARGSVFECVTMLQISFRQGYIDNEKFDDLKSKLTDLSKMLSGLKKSVNR
jgi:four helix bundle protein